MNHFVWYGAIAWLGYRVGDDWERLQAAVGSTSRIMGVGAVVAVAVALLAYWLRTRRRRGAGGS